MRTLELGCGDYLLQINRITGAYIRAICMAVIPEMIGSVPQQNVTGLASSIYMQYYLLISVCVTP